MADGSAPQSDQWDRQTSTSAMGSDNIFCNKYMPAFLSLKNIQPFFDISSKQLILRLGLALIPFNKKFVDNYNQKPDLYGPFWILNTLIASLFISSNFYCYIAAPDSKKEVMTSSFQTIPVAASIIYGVGVGLPLLMKLMLNLYGTQPANQNS